MTQLQLLIIYDIALTIFFAVSVITGWLCKSAMLNRLRNIEKRIHIIEQTRIQCCADVLAKVQELEVELKDERVKRKAYDTQQDARLSAMEECYVESFSCSIEDNIPDSLG